MQGGTLTVTSLGPLGGVATTPVINRPEVAIIGPNRIIERPMYVSDGNGGERIEKRKLMNISISCDHRVVDGWDAASFVQALKKLLVASQPPVIACGNAPAQVRDVFGRGEAFAPAQVAEATPVSSAVD